MNPRKTLEMVLDAASRQMVETAEMAKAMRYYECHQDTEEIIQYRIAHDMPDYVVPLIPEAINSVLGAEEQRRVDPIIKADDDESEEIAEALNVRLNEAWRIHNCNARCSDAYKPMIIKGLGWVYVGKNTDPMGSKYDVHEVPTFEIIEDKRSRMTDQRDARFVARKRFLDKDGASALLPGHDKLIEDVYARCADQWDIIQSISSSGGPGSGTYTGLDETHYLEHIYHRDPVDLVAVYDVYYRAYEATNIIQFDDGRKIKYDPDNAEHAIAYMSGEAIVYNRVIPLMRNAWYIGPYLISDELSPHPHNEFPYVKFKGYQEESTNIHYGLVRSMISSQDAYNEANVKQHHLMNTVTVIMDEDALPDGVTDEDLLDEVNRADRLIKKRRNSELKIEDHWAQIDKLSQIKADAREEIRAASGISYSFAGKDVEQKSGVAIASLAEMSAATLAEINANYQLARQKVAELILAHEVNEIGTQPTEVAVRSDTGETRKRIAINAPAEDGTISNALPRARMQVALADAQTAEGYRAQNQQMLKDMFFAAPDELKLDIFQLMIKESNMPGRHEFLAQVARKQGRGATEEEQAQIIEAQQQQAAEQADLDKQRQLAEIDKIKAEAAKAYADANANAGQMTDTQSNAAEQQADQAEKDKRLKLAELASIREEIGNKALVA
jgi:hypothetical protein